LTNKDITRHHSNKQQNKNGSERISTHINQTMAKKKKIGNKMIIRQKKTLAMSLFVDIKTKEIRSSNKRKEKKKAETRGIERKRKRKPNIGSRKEN
jgi:ssDNA-binding Zn-finger/Zn-ribbon topoisomerase 1